MKVTTILLLCLLVTGVSAFSLKSQQSTPWDIRMTCTDSDKGRNYFERGTVSTYDPSVRKNVRFTDECSQSGIPSKSKRCAGSTCGVLEGYCGEKGFELDRYFCSGGCKDGACLPAITGTRTTNCRKSCSMSEKNCRVACPLDKKKLTNCVTECKLESQTCVKSCPKY